NMKKIAASGKKAVVEIPELEKSYPAAKGADQEKLLDQAIATLVDLGDESPFTERYAKIARDALKLDPDNKSGRKLKAVEALIGAGQVDADVASAATALDPKNEKGLFEKVVAFRMGTIRQKDDIEPALKVLDDFLAVGAFKDVTMAKR